MVVPDPMMTMIREFSTADASPVAMSGDAYAGFIQLLLTPDDALPRATRELDAYLAWLDRVDPLSAEAQNALKQTRNAGSAFVQDCPRPWAA